MPFFSTYPPFERTERIQIPPPWTTSERKSSSDFIILPPLNKFLGHVEQSLDDDDESMADVEDTTDLRKMSVPWLLNSSASIDTDAIESDMHPQSPSSIDLSTSRYIGVPHAIRETTYTSTQYRDIIPTQDGRPQQLATSNQVQGPKTVAQAKPKRSNLPYTNEEKDFIQYHREDCDMQWEQILSLFNQWLVACGKPDRQRESDQCLNGSYYRDQWYVCLDDEGDWKLFGDLPMLQKVTVRMRKEAGANRKWDLKTTLVKQFPRRCLRPENVWIRREHEDQASRQILLEECGAIRSFELRIGRERQQCYFVEKQSSGTRSPSRKAQPDDNLDFKRACELKIEVDMRDLLSEDCKSPLGQLRGKL